MPIKTITKQGLMIFSNKKAFTIQVCVKYFIISIKKNITKPTWQVEEHYGQIAVNLAGEIPDGTQGCHFSDDYHRLRQNNSSHRHQRRQNCQRHQPPLPVVPFQLPLALSPPVPDELVQAEEEKCRVEDCRGLGEDPRVEGEPRVVAGCRGCGGWICRVHFICYVWEREI